MLAVADCVVLATPAMKGGGKLMDRERIGRMKQGARFVNVARGGLVDEEALADAVEEGRLSGVALDVHAEEPRVCERLRGRREVLLTAHNAGGTLDTLVLFLCFIFPLAFLDCFLPPLIKLTSHPPPNLHLPHSKNISSIEVTHTNHPTPHRHKGFESISMSNIDAFLKGHPPLTPVNMHLISPRAEPQAPTTSSDPS